MNISETSLQGVSTCLSLLNLWKHKLNTVRTPSLYRNFISMLRYSRVLSKSNSLLLSPCSAVVERADWTEASAALLRPHNTHRENFPLIFQSHTKAITNAISVSWEFWQSKLLTDPASETPGAWHDIPTLQKTNVAKSLVRMHLPSLQYWWNTQLCSGGVT